MKRRQLIGAGAAAAAGSLMANQAAAQQRAAQATRAMPSPIIKDVQVIATAPAGLRLVVVKILTDQDGLYGYGCGTFTQRADLVVAAVERYLKPFITGMKADRIDDIWQACYNSSYWRNSGVLNNAISGVDMALWDIKGRQASMPVYQLLGGKCREAADCYGHAGGTEIPEILDSVRSYMNRGYRHIRVQFGQPGQAAYGSRAGANYNQIVSSVPGRNIAALHDKPFYDPADYCRKALKVFEAVRKEFGDEIELLHDTHERVSPTQAIQLAKDMERFRLFFLEDPLSPEDIAYFRHIRNQCATPIAMGELFNSPHEWIPLVQERLIDYIRVHLSQMGGVTPCRKMAAMCELYNVRTAWHGPGDVSPIGHAANVALDLACYNFGVQEWSGFNERVFEVFSGVPTFKDGYAYANEAPGWGIEVDEKAAAKYPFGYGEQGERKRLNGGWGEVRKRDGTIIKQ
jgi:mannonate dehydratase